MSADSGTMACQCGAAIPAPMRVDSRHTLVCPHCDRVWIGVPDDAGGWWRQAGKPYTGPDHIDVFDMPASLDGQHDSARDLTGELLLGYDLGRACRTAGYWRRTSMRRLAALEEIDRLLQDEFGGYYESAPRESPLGQARTIARTARPSRCPTEGPRD